MLNSSSIVLLGNFNPAIFHPEWFDRFKVLPIQEVQWAEGEKAEQTEVKLKDRKLIISETPPLIVQPHLAHLEFPSLTILVQADKFQCSTVKRDKFSLIRDVTIKTFSLLGHTPVRALGTNFEGHLKYKEPADVILKRLFAREDDRFRNALGGSQIPPAKPEA